MPEAKTPLVSFAYNSDGSFEGTAPPALSQAVSVIPWGTIIAAIIADAPAIWALIQQIITQLKKTTP